MRIYVTEDDRYTEADASGNNWHMMLGDACERMAEIPDDSVDLSVCSPPFASLFTYSPSPRDVGNCATRAEFLDHYRFIIREQLRVTKPGRNACIHIQQVTTRKSTAGFIGITDFRGDVIRAFQAEGWIFFGEVTVWKNPQAQAIRTKAHSLMFVTKNRDSAQSRPALADYLLIFKKPGENAVRIPHADKDGEVTNEQWIEWAGPIWYDQGDSGDVGGNHLSPVWTTIRETDTLNARVARENGDERHICPLQLGFIDRCIKLWSLPGETVFSPFAGIGSEVYQAVKLGRKGIGIELKRSYWNTAVDNLTSLEKENTCDGALWTEDMRSNFG